MKAGLTFVAFVFVGPMIGGLAFIVNVLIVEQPDLHSSSLGQAAISAIGLAALSAGFGFIFGIVPAAITGAVCALLVGRMRRFRFVVAAIGLGLLCSIAWALWLWRERPYDPAMIVAFGLAGAVAAGVSAHAALWLRGPASGTPR